MINFSEKYFLEMTEEFFYHYTPYEGATAIQLGRETIKYNNWDGTGTSC
jgi:hypothetical protein